MATQILSIPVILESASEVMVSTKRFVCQTGGRADQWNLVNLTETDNALAMSKTYGRLVYPEY